LSTKCGGKGEEQLVRVARSSPKELVNTINSFDRFIGKEYLVIPEGDI
jgi:hypothetical protein